MIVADKPAAFWIDEDFTGFEIKLSDLARRFKNLEALQKEVATKGEGFEARKVTVTRPDGQETHGMVWIDRENQDQIESVLNEILGILNKYDNNQLQQAVVARLTERVLGSLPQDAVAQIRRKRQDRKHEQETG